MALFGHRNHHVSPEEGSGVNVMSCSTLTQFAGNEAILEYIFNFLFTFLLYYAFLVCSHWEVCLEKICRTGLFLCPCHVNNHSRTISLPAVYFSNYGTDLIHNCLIGVP